MTNQSKPAPKPKGGKRPGAGRKPGSKSKVTVAKLAARQVAVETAVGKAPKRPAPVAAKKGISPKDLMLESMRSAWETHYRLMDEARQVKAEAEALGKDHAAYGALIERVGNLKTAADAALTEATDLAVKAAPYEHAKLANVDTRVRGNVVVKIAKF